VARSFDEIDAATLARYRGDLAAFIEECLISPYDGQPYRLNAAERAFIKHAFKLDADGRLVNTLLLYSAIKKSRKTELAGLLVLAVILLLGGRYAEGVICANDQEQAVSRCFTACCRIVEASPLLQPMAKITGDKIVFAATGSTISAIASNYAAIAGGHPTIAVFDELWAFSSERAVRLWDELIPVPTRKISCRLVVTHAGFSGEGELLHSLYQRGLRLPLVGQDLRAGDGMVMFWSHQPICHWQDERWLAAMRRDLPQNQYLRMIENRFVTSESSFVNMDKWDACVDSSWRPVIFDKAMHVWVGVDVGTKCDSTGIVGVGFDRASKRVRLAFHRTLTPSATRPLQFVDVEATLKELSHRFQFQRVLVDPWQMSATVQRLVAAGLPIEEFPQTPGNMTQISQNLYELIEGNNLVLYADDSMRLAASRAVAAETARGFRIDKAKAVHKVDVIVALALACHAAVLGAAVPYFDSSYSGFADDTAAVPAGRTSNSHVIGELRSAIAGGYGWGPSGGRRW
jgi:hypothetical protein